MEGSEETTIGAGEEFRRITLAAREVLILQYLRESYPSGGRNASEIWTEVRSRAGGMHLRDDVVVQAYYKVLRKLEATGRVRRFSKDGTELYALTDPRFVENSLDLDQIREAWAELPPQAKLARILKWRRHVVDNRNSILRRAAEELLNEDPRDLFFEMVYSNITELQAQLDLIAQGGLTSRKDEERVKVLYARIEQTLYRVLGAGDLFPALSNLHTLVEDARKKQIFSFGDNEKRILRELVNKRVFGNTFIEKVPKMRKGPKMVGQSHPPHIASGSDGSTHIRGLPLTTARSYYPEDGLEIIAFNNAVAAFQSKPKVSTPGMDFPYHSIPPSRESISDPQNLGLVMSKAFYPTMDEGIYEHMAKQATDTVQYRVDAQVISGLARSLKDGRPLGTPHILIRDGTVVPQDREFKHYLREGAAGDFVREAFTLLRSILLHVSGEGGVVYAGAAKSVSLEVFTSLVGWYIRQGSSRRLGMAIDPTWSDEIENHIKDNETMTLLLSSLEDGTKHDYFYVSCIIVRPFYATSELYKRHGLPGDNADWSTWVKFFDDVKRARLERLEAEGDEGEPPMMSDLDPAKDAFAFVCANAHFALFYVGHSFGDPPPSLPRYEFLCKLTGLGLGKRAQVVRENVERIVESLGLIGFADDREHNFLTQKRATKIVPKVTYDAHEMGKTLGRVLEQQLLSAVVEELSVLKIIPEGSRASTVELSAVSAKDYVLRLGPDEEEGEGNP